MERFQEILFDAKMLVTSVVFVEEQGQQVVDPYLAEMRFEGEVPGHGHFHMDYRSPTAEPAGRRVGEFTGSETVLRPDGSHVAGVVRGIWRRDERVMKLFVLSNQSDGTQILRLIDVPLHDNQDRTARVVSYGL